MTIETRHLAIGADRLCTFCAGGGAYLPASAKHPARPGTPGELRAYREHRKSSLRQCGHCQGSGIQPGSRILRAGDSDAETFDLWPSLPSPTE